MPLIGYMDTASASTTAHFVEAFRRGLSAAGYDEGRNVGIEYRWSEGDYDKLPALAAELVRRQVAVIATINAPTILAAKAATQQFRSSSGSALIRLSSAWSRALTVRGATSRA